jgi:hypothetical protein
VKEIKQAGYSKCDQLRITRKKISVYLSGDFLLVIKIDFQK